MNSQQALERLKEGNGRFVEGKTTARNFATERSALLTGQKPFVAMVSCADSRVSPEHVFDVGLGQLFSVRNAGNVVTDIDMGTLEYGVAHLGIPLLVVMGHQKCGAVTAAYDGHNEGHITAIVKDIHPAVQAVKKGGDKAQEVEATIAANVKRVIADLRKKSVIIAQAEKAGRLKIVGMKYSLETGKAEMLE